MDRARVRDILVIKLRAIGDVLLSTIVLRNLRLAFPESRIDFLVERSAADIVRGHPDVNGTVVYDRSSMSGLDLIRLVRKKKYDLVLDLFGNPRTALVTFLSRAPWRVGYRFRGRTYAYNIVVSPRGGHVHNTQFNLDALTAIGVDILDRTLSCSPTAADFENVDRFLAEAGLTGQTMVALNNGGGWYTKRWGPEHFAALGDRLSERYAAAIVLIWGPGEEAEARDIASRMSSRPFIPPPTTLMQLGALLKRCMMLVTNDSGPMHIAAAMGTPVLGIFGPTNPALQGPYGEGHAVVRNETLTCLGCNLTSCPIGHPCMIGLTVDTVLDSAGALLKKHTVIP